MPRVYIPRQGDFIYLTFDPQAGHEQKGRRPALVISKDMFNSATGLAMVCPITTTRRDYPFHVAVPAGKKLSGIIMVEQVKSVDYRARNAQHVSAAPEETLKEVLDLLDAILFDSATA